MRCLVACLLLISLTGSVISHKTRYGPRFAIKLNNATLENLLEFEQRIIVVDPDDAQLTFEQNTILKNKGKMILAYISLGQAETIRDYWKPDWTVGSPDFIYKVDPKFDQGFIVKFWTPEWQERLYNYTETFIAPFGYAGLWMDYMKEYTNFIKERPTADQEMVDLGLKVASIMRERNPQSLIITQDSIDLYKFEEYKNMVDGVAVEEVFYTHEKTGEDTYSYSVRPPAYTSAQLEFLDQIALDKKAVFLEEYIEKNRHICEFYKKCALSGFICGVFDLASTGASRECIVRASKF